MGDSGQILRKLIGHNKVVECVSVNWVKFCALSGSQDSTLWLWDMHQGTCLWLFRGHAAIKCVSVNWDELYAFSGGSQLQYWTFDNLSTTGKCSAEVVSLLLHGDRSVHWVSVHCALQLVESM